MLHAVVNEIKKVPSFLKNDSLTGEVRLDFNKRGLDYCGPLSSGHMPSFDGT